MKIKKIITAILFSILVISSNQYGNIYAENEIVEETHEQVPNIRRSPVSEDESSIIYESEAYLKQKYGTNEWTRGRYNTTITISNGIPIEMQNTGQYDMIEDICKDPDMDLDSSYGGCGPIAMIGMADFFSRIYGYTEIINDPDDVEQQKNLVKEFLKIIPTSETSKGTLAYPWNSVKGFNEVMKNHNLENTIKATDMGCLGVSKNSKITEIKRQVDKGLPVTLYAGEAGEGELGNHYVNVYGYEDWHGVDKNDKNIIHTMLLFRMNWGKRYNDKTLYMDSDILGSLLTGIIYYDITYKYQPLPDMLFQVFKNQNGQNQYFNEVVERPFTITKYEFEMSFMSRRLRCSYLEQGYLVLSANKDNNDTAYLELEFEEDVRKVGLDLYQWSTNEQFSGDSSLRLEYFDESTNEWGVAKDIFIFGLPLKENLSPDTIVTVLPKPSKKIRIIVENKGITTDRNKGRIVINCIDVYLDTYNQFYEPHTQHVYDNSFGYSDENYHRAFCACGHNQLEEHTYTYVTIDETTHGYYCKCGYGHIEPHIIDTSNQIHGTFHCIKCNETIEIEHDFTCSYENNGKDGHIAYCECGETINEEHTLVVQNEYMRCQYCDYLEHNHQYVYYEEYDLSNHIAICECGDIKMEMHDVGELIMGHCMTKCLYCNANVDIYHVYNNYYEYYNEHEHWAYCICGEVVLVEHRYSEDGICVCGYEQEHNHQFIYEEYNETYHQRYCECGDSIRLPHNIVSCVCIECGYIAHQHVYSEWKYYNNISHIESCSCGHTGTITKAHVISANDIGKRYAKCLECNHLLDLNSDIGIVPMSASSNNQLITTNGSYILSNGIIVLVDEDIEAYFNETLIFYNDSEYITN